tara:strand:+ start:2484 stop:2687 length:204 start_codon:yes stop_codon:yes gene_type:complete
MEMHEQNRQEIARAMQGFIMRATKSITEDMVANSDTTGLRLVAEALKAITEKLTQPPQWTDFDINLN